MATFETSVPAATAVVGFDLLSDLPFVRVSGGNRILRRAALSGSAAAGDSRVSLTVGGVPVGRLFNVGTGFPQSDRDMRSMGDAFIPAGEALSALVEDAPVTNPLNLLVEVEEL